MGVEFFSCTYCDETYADCGNYFSCNCGINYCCDTCADSEEDGDGCRSCRICRKEYQTEWVLLTFMLNRCGLTREEATQLYFKSIETKKRRK